MDTFKTPTGTVEKVYLSQDEYSLLQKVEGFAESYLNPQVGNKEGYLVLRHKMMAKPISMNTYSGQTYLQVAHTKGARNISIPAALNMYKINKGWLIEAGFGSNFYDEGDDSYAHLESG